MAWDDARNIKEANSRARVDGQQHMLRVYRSVMNAEQETLPDDALADERPVREVVAQGTRTVQPSWRYRVTVDSVVFDSLLQRGHNMPSITEVELVEFVGRTTQAQREQLSDDKDDALADWRIAGYEIVVGIKKKRRVKITDPEHEAKMMAWEGRKNAVPRDGSMMQASPAKMMNVLREAEGFELRIAWVDMARQEEPRVGAFNVYRENGYYPPVYQKQRTEAFRILRQRFAGTDGSLTSLPADKVQDVLQMAAGGMAADRIATFLGLDPEVVKRVVVMRAAKAPSIAAAAETGNGVGGAPAKKPRKKREASKTSDSSSQETSGKEPHPPSPSTPPTAG